MEAKYKGQGGKYLTDPKTGKTTLVSQTKPAKPVTTTTPIKEESNAKEN